MEVGSCLVALLIVSTLCGTPFAQPFLQTRRVTWTDVIPVHDRLKAAGLTDAAFPSYVERTHVENVRRVREGDLDHLIFYILQSKSFTRRPPIEPAISAKALVERLGPDERSAFLTEPVLPAAQVPQDARDRITAFAHEIAKSPDGDKRRRYFSALTTAVFPDPRRRADGLTSEYLRVMRFVYEKEFVAQRAAQPADAIGELYRTRGLSTDTAVEAGFLVFEGLGVARSLEPAPRIRRVLIVGPGLDLAPRTGMVDERPAESYQPWAVIDALLGLRISRADDLDVVAADINPRVVEHLRAAHSMPLTLRLISEIRDGNGISIAADYRDYFAQLGRSLGEVEAFTPRSGGLGKQVRVKPSVVARLSSAPLDIVTERLDGPPFDLVIATNILPYFDDVQLALAMSNIAAMTAPGGVFLHNEPRPVLGDITTAVGLTFLQARHATIANVQGATTPLFDRVFVHRKR